VIAAKDGQIKYMEVYEGQAMFVPGNTVSKGEVIVSGVMQDKHNNIRVVYARAKVIAQVYEKLVAEMPLETMELVPSGKIIDTYGLRIWDMPLRIINPKRPECRCV
jgi:similar to stage IV sporulation protein